MLCWSSRAIAAAIGLGILFAASNFLTAPVMAGNNLPSSTANHQAVTEGVFDLKRGQTIDLTDRKILLAFPNDSLNSDASLAKRSNVFLKLNGGNHYTAIGRRTDLKAQYKDLLRDMSECFLDVLDIVLPKGATPIVQLRLSCK